MRSARPAVQPAAACQVAFGQRSQAAAAESVAQYNVFAILLRKLGADPRS